MSKKIIIAAVAIAISAAASVFACRTGVKDEKTALFNANVAALSEFESSRSKAACYSEYRDDNESHCLVCGSCSYEKGVGTDIGGYCKW